MSRDKKQITMKDFEDWLDECPVPYKQTCNGLNTTEYYSFNLIDCEMEDSDKEQCTLCEGTGFDCDERCDDCNGSGEVSINE